LFVDRNIEVLGCPARSLDFNIIENVWDYITFELRGRVFESTDELWEEVLSILKAIPQEKILKLYESLPRRIEAVLEAQGSHTKYQV